MNSFFDCKKVRFLLFTFVILLIGLQRVFSQDSMTTILETAQDSFLIDALLQKGSEVRSYDRKLALEYQLKALKEADRLDDRARKGRALNAVGITYAMLENYPNAISHFEEYRKIQQDIRNFHGVADSYNNLGNTYRYIGDFPESIRMHLTALHLYDSLGLQTGRASALHNLGIVHDLTGELDQSLDFFKQAYAIRMEIKDDQALPSTIHSLGLMYEKMEILDSALLFMDRYLARVKDHGKNPNAASTYNTIGRLFMAQSKYDSAQLYLTKSIELARALEIKQPMIHALHNLSQLNIKQKKLDTALSYNTEQIELAKSIENKLFLKDGYLLRSQILEGLGFHDQAYQYLKESMELQDELYEDEKVNHLKQWQVKLDVYDKERKLKEQEVELQWLNKQNKVNKQNKLLLIIALSLSIFIGMVFYRQNQFKKKANLDLMTKNQFIDQQKREIERMNQELEVRMLRAQINPHFIFNALSSIQHFIVTNEKHSALKYLTKFSTLLRQVLEESVNGKVSLKEEIQLLSIYLELEALRFDGNFQYNIEIDEGLDTDNLEIPILIIQPFVENALFHGLLPSDKEKILTITFSNNDDQIKCSILDNGIGRKAAGQIKRNTGHQSPSRGIQVTQNRLASLYPQEKSEELIILRDLYTDNNEPAGTELIINIPKE